MTFSKIPPALIPGNTPIFLNTTIGIDTIPPEIAASENPINWIFNTISIGSNAAASTTIQVLSTPINGDIFSLISAGGFFPTVELLASNSPTFGEYDNTGTLTEIADSIANALNEDIVFNRLFYADSLTAPENIIITAIEPGSLYTVIFSGSLAFVPTMFTFGQSEFFGQSLQDFIVFIDVFAQAPENFGEVVDKNGLEFIARIQKNYQKDNLMAFDVSGVLKNGVNSGLPAGPGVVKYTEAVTNYCLMFGFIAKDDNNISTRVITGITGVNWINNAAIGLLKTNDLVDYIFVTLAINKSFLSNLPECKDFWPGQKDYLNFIYKETPAIINEIDFFIEPTFYDGTTGSLTLLTNKLITGGQHSFDLSNLPIGTIETLNGKKIRDFTIYARPSVAVGIAPNVAEQKYIIRRDCPERTIDIVFLNSLGGWDGVRMIERIEQGARRNITEFEKSPPVDPVGTEIVRGVRETVVNCSERWASGWLPESHYNWLKEIQSSTKVYLSTPSGFQYIVLESTQIDYDDEAKKYNLIIEYTPTVNENSVKQ
jgi:hypothetical protein